MKSASRTLTIQVGEANLGSLDKPFHISLDLPFTRPELLWACRYAASWAYSCGCDVTDSSPLGYQ